MSSDSDAVRRRLDAERVTWVAQGFLNRLGYKRAVLHPKKVSVEGERYLVEVQVKKRTATVQVDVTTGEIKGYQFEESTEETGFLSKKMLLIIGCIASIAIIITVLKLTGIF